MFILDQWNYMGKFLHEQRMKETGEDIGGNELTKWEEAAKLIIYGERSDEYLSLTQILLKSNPRFIIQMALLLRFVIHELTFTPK